MNRPAPHAPLPIGSIGADDPRLTAYALDALDAADRAAVEAALAADPALRALVDETRAAAATLSAALPRDGASLTALQRQAILLRGTARPARLRRWTPFMLGSSAAAAVLLAIGLRVTTVERRAVTMSAAPRSGADGAIVGGYMAGGPTPRALMPAGGDGAAGGTYGTAGGKMPIAEAGSGSGGGGTRQSSLPDFAKPGLDKQLAQVQQDLADTTKKLQAEAAAARGALEAERVSRRTIAENQAASEKVPSSLREPRDPTAAPSLGDNAQGIGVAGQGASAPNDDLFFGVPPSPVSAIDKAFRAGEFAKARELARDVLKANPNHEGVKRLIDLTWDAEHTARMDYTNKTFAEEYRRVLQSLAPGASAVAEKEIALSFLGLERAGTATSANWNDAYRFAGTPELEGLRGLAVGQAKGVSLAGRAFRVERRGQGLLFVAGDAGNGMEPGAYYLPDGSNEAYATVEESPFLRVADARLSTFSIDVDTASYANVRRMLTAGQRPPADAVRVEELLNYFPYEYPAPTGTDPFAVHLEVAECPWDVTHRLVRVGIQGRPLERKARPPMNLVFLVDVSGSMNAPNKLPLVQASLRMLLEELNERDSVAIVVYAGASGLALPPTWCEQKAEIQRVIDDLRPGGSTNGAAGIELAYEIATQRFVKDGVNRVVLATDGDFNVGVTSRDALHALITAKAKSGVFLTCLGYGMGNLKDATLELLADKGNGNYGYIDSTREARKVLVDEASGTLVTIAKDVKLQVEFNPATVASYRLIGYDNRRLADRDFADDTKDAGEVGAGHRVTALYEVVPVGAPDAAAVAPTTEEPLRYGAKPAPVAAPAGPMAPENDLGKELLTVKVRWKEPAGTVSTKREFPLVDGGTSYGKASRDFKFAASVVGFGMKLRGSPYAAKLTWDAVAEWASEGLSFDPGAYRAEFVDLVAKAKALPR